MFYPLQSHTFGEDEMKGILKVLRQGNFWMGEQVDLFEKTFATKMGFKYAVMMNSGSAASLAAVASLCLLKDGPLKQGDEVIAPALGWSTSFYPLQQYGLKVRFVDVEISTLGIDPNHLERAITPKTRAVLAINMMGNPAQMDTIKQICRTKNLYLIEDSNSSMGAELKGRKCGAFGDVSTFSTGSGQLISTMEGGVLATENKDIYHIAKALRAYGWTREVPPQSTAFQTPTEGPEQTRFVIPGYNLRPLELCAAAGVEQLKKLDGLVEVRRQNACLLYASLQNDKRFLMPKENGKATWSQFVIFLHPTMNLDRARVMQKLQDNGIQSTYLPLQNITKHDCIRYFNHEIVGKLDIANVIHERGFVVGNGSVDLTSQLERLHKTLVALAPAGAAVPASPKKPGFPFAAGPEK